MTCLCRATAAGRALRFRIGNATADRSCAIGDLN